MALARIVSSTLPSSRQQTRSLLRLPTPTAHYTAAAAAAHPPRRRAKSGQEMDSPPVPEDLLLDIFLRIPDPADLVRTSAACVSFRRLVADRSFLRKYRKVHAPPLLGFLGGVQIFCPAVPPHPYAAAASAVALAADFSFSFLPARNWVEQDIRDGRVLLDRISTEIVVCDPLHRRYLLLPPIPDDNEEACHTFLAPSGDNEEETAFRVIRMARRGDKLVALVFSSSTGQWQAGPSHSWSDSFADLLRGPGLFSFSRPHYAYGCFYWLTDSREMLMLDTRKMEFSIADAPPEAQGSCDLDIAIVEAGEGRPGMFVLSNGTPDLSFIIGRNIGGSSVHWQLEKTISLGFRYYFLGSVGRQLFLMHDGTVLSLDVKTFQREVVCASKYKNMIWPRPYSNFPPSLLSSPTVEVVSRKGPRRIRCSRAVPQAQAHSHHGQGSVFTNAGGQDGALRSRHGAVVVMQLRRLTTKLVCFCLCFGLYLIWSPRNLGRNLERSSCMPCSAGAFVCRIMQREHDGC